MTQKSTRLDINHAPKGPKRLFASPARRRLFAPARPAAPSLNWHLGGENSICAQLAINQPAPSGVCRLSTALRNLLRRKFCLCLRRPAKGPLFGPTARGRLAKSRPLEELPAQSRVCSNVRQSIILRASPRQDKGQLMMTPLVALASFQLLFFLSFAFILQPRDALVWSQPKARRAQTRFQADS